MPKKSRREEVLAAALEAFTERGFAGTSIADIVAALGVSQSDFAGWADKEQLLMELVVPLLDDLDATLDAFPRHPSWPDQGQELLAAYLDVLIEHRGLVNWIDGDRAVLHHATIGKRLAESNRRVQEAVRGDNRSTAARLGASAVLGALWRPLRTLTEIDADREKDAMLAIAMAVVSTVRAL